MMDNEDEKKILTSVMNEINVGIPHPSCLNKLSYNKHQKNNEYVKISIHFASLISTSSTKKSRTIF